MIYGQVAVASVCLDLMWLWTPAIQVTRNSAVWTTQLPLWYAEALVTALQSAYATFSDVLK